MFVLITISRSLISFLDLFLHDRPDTFGINDEADRFISSSISCHLCHPHSNLINMDVIASSVDLSPLPSLVKDQHLMIWTELALNSINVKDVLELIRER